MQGSHPPFFPLFSFCDPLLFGSGVRAQTPVGRLLVSQMSGVHGKMRLVLSSQEAGQANCAFTHCADQRESPGRSSSSVDVETETDSKRTKTIIFRLFPAPLLLTF